MFLRQYKDKSFLWAQHSDGRCVFRVIQPRCACQSDISFTDYRQPQHHRAKQFGYKFRLDISHHGASSLKTIVPKEEALRWFISNRNL